MDQMNLPFPNVIGQKTICFDVDGTLVNFNDTPNYLNIELLLHFKRLGWQIFVWSGGGIDYAERWVQKLGLNLKVIEKGSMTPDIAVDDEQVILGLVNIKV